MASKGHASTLARADSQQTSWPLAHVPTLHLECWSFGWSHCVTCKQLTTTDTTYVPWGLIHRLWIPEAGLSASSVIMLLDVITKNRIVTLLIQDRCWQGRFTSFWHLTSVWTENVFKVTLKLKGYNCQSFMFREHSKHRCSMMKNVTLIWNLALCANIFANQW